MGPDREGQVRIWVVSGEENGSVSPMPMKTCSRYESEAVEPKQRAALLDYIPIFEDPEFCPGQIIPLDECGLPDGDFMTTVSRFMDACYKNGFVVRFDWEGWEAEGTRAVNTPEPVQAADIAYVRRLLTWHIRQNRVTRNHVASMIASGHILLVLKRLSGLDG